VHLLTCHTYIKVTIIEQVLGFVKPAQLSNERVKIPPNSGTVGYNLWGDLMWDIFSNRISLVINKRIFQ
jgi:hypothetical protein